MNVNMKDNKSFHEILINETLFLHIIITPSETTFYLDCHYFGLYKLDIKRMWDFI